MLVVVLLFAAVFFRFHDLGSPGFYGDEETTSLAAYSLARGNGSVMPSGMEYRRAILHSYAAAVSARAFGTEQDRSYRIPSAVIGVATVLLVFLGTRQLLGTTTALVVTALVAVSEWHILLSRTVRMYGPMLFFALAFVYSTLAWTENGKWRDLALAAAGILIAGSLHLLAVLMLPVLILPHLSGALRMRKLAAAAMLAAGFAVAMKLFRDLYTAAPYRDFMQSGSRQAMSSGDVTTESFKKLPAAISDFTLTWPVTILVVVGLGIGVWFARSLQLSARTHDNWLRRITLLAACLATSIAAALGHAYGAFMFLLITLLVNAPIDRARLAMLWKPAAVAVVLIVGWVLYRVVSEGPIGGFKESLRYPFPYLLYQARDYPGVVAFFLAGIATCIFGPDDRRHRILRVLALTALLPILGLGMIHEWKPDRYLLTVYPLVLIVAAAGLMTTCRWICDRVALPARRQPVILALAVVVSGLLGAHGLPQALAHSPTDYGASISTTIAYPDHRAPGCFVRDRLRPGDLVVAEDALQQQWYAGQVDYLLRDPEGHRFYSYLDKHGAQRDIYVGSAITTDDVIADLATATATGTRIWVITSAESRVKPDLYLAPESQQQAWLAALTAGHEPVFTGRDGYSAVYCINCDLGDDIPDASAYNCR